MKKTIKTKYDIKKEVFLNALEMCFANVSKAAEMCVEQGLITGVTAGYLRQWHYNSLKSDEEYEKSYVEIISVKGDFIEDMLMEKIKEGDTTAIIFACKTLLKKRGYIEKQEVEQEKEEAPQIFINFVQAEK
jgi:hypothetical protein